MRDVINCIKKYIEIIENEKFIVHWKKLSTRLLKGIQNGYIKNYREENIVKIIKDIINSTGQFSTRGNNFNISTASIFIHGNRSQVEFEYHGKRTQRELGDIIFILSVVYNGKKYFEKMTINQVKKSKATFWNFNSDSTKEQLYLLSRFPTFKGIRGLIPLREYNFPNNSGCLGTHGLLYYPGDFALISSKRLEVILSEKNKLTLYSLIGEFAPNSMCCFPCCYLLYDYNLDIEKCLYFLHKLPHFYPKYFRLLPFMCNLPVLGISCIAYNAYDFSNKYLVGHIGELIYAKNLPYNSSAFQFLQDLLNAVKKKQKEST